MKETIILGWQFWPNPHFLTLTTGNNKIRSDKQAVYGLVAPEGGQHYVHGAVEQKRYNLFLNLSRLCLIEPNSLIRKLVFYNVGMDIELFDTVSIDIKYDLMRHVEANVRGIFHPKAEVTFTIAEKKK